MLALRGYHMDAANPLPSASRAVTEPRLGRRRTSPAVGNLVAAGLARLVEGQRDFADEFGLPYSQVFSDGYASFKARDPEQVIKSWFAGGEAGAARLQALFEDLWAHQAGLAQAAEGVLLAAVHQQLEEFPDEGAGNLPAWARLLRTAVNGAPRRSLTQSLFLIAPAFVAAYQRSRVGARRGVRNLRAALRPRRLREAQPAATRLQEISAADHR